MDNVALKAKTVEESTTSGIIIPGDKDEQKNFAEVVAAGDGTVLLDVAPPIRRLRDTLRPDFVIA